MISTEKLKNTFSKIKENRLDSLTVAIVLGISLISLGIYVIGSKIYPYLGSRMIIIGSGIFYVSVILLVFLME